MKIFFSFLIVALVVIILTYSIGFMAFRNEMQEEIKKRYLGFHYEDYTVLEFEDTHGGFLGDGHLFYILDCSQKKDIARETIKNWKPLPLTENLNKAMYTHFDNFVEWTHIENGVYRFLDRNSEAVNPDDDSELFNRASSNFSIAMYDLDNDILYFFALDT